MLRLIPGMLQAELPKRTAPSSPACEPQPTAPIPRSTTTTNTNEQSERFYRTVECENRHESAEFPDRNAVAEAAAVRRQLSLEDTRRNALHTLSLCRSVIASLEITRLHKSRTGLHYWLGFWERIYERPFARMLSSRVTGALARIDTLFRAVSNELHQLTRRMNQDITHATSEQEILRLLERMEEEVGTRRRRRRKKAQSIVQKMRANIESIPVKVTDELFDDLKRGVFALDVYCDYHPGDSVAEEHESAWPERCSPMRSVAVSPYLQNQWHESAAAGAYMPMPSQLESDLGWTEHVEDWVNPDEDHFTRDHHAHTTVHHR
ncbi:hypothetical protein BO70DRAFT_359552 [Aspergillus heteromorphus CBS 117.55]|uniref:Uncharacterized protein n=1 Tax=Aspergillus heteromorphus CBS 117.55 TaxID=1448321 RepID=A0A317WYI9_9EURO|nr:uncharacterized protein BO70DRAFT_359552 [Aspergillus heteromorphus CBS 117.55]PWY89270.1 hypothetical protein BO70DRAFT_359552 [Aspergillus heteromorphus CBS 117.55]